MGIFFTGLNFYRQGAAALSCICLDPVIRLSIVSMFPGSSARVFSQIELLGLPDSLPASPYPLSSFQTVWIADQNCAPMTQGFIRSPKFFQQ